MTLNLIRALLLWLLVSTVAASQEAVPSGVESTGTADDRTGIQKEPALTGERHPLYRLRKSDVLEIHFTFTPEYDQTVAVQPDGFIALKGAGNVLAEGRDLSELTRSVAASYSFMQEPEVSITLKDFEKPFFLVGGQVGHPGKYDLRAPTTVTEAVAIAGGFTEAAKHSQVLLFRKTANGLAEARLLNAKAMLGAGDLAEDIEIRPGDMIYVPQNRISKIRKYLPVATLNTFFSPSQF